MGGDSRGFMGMGSLLGQAADPFAQTNAAYNQMAQGIASQAAQFSQNDFMRQLVAQQEQRAAYDRWVQQVKTTPPMPATAPKNPKADEIRKYYDAHIAEYMETDKRIVIAKPKNNIDKLRAEVREWTKRAA